MARISSSSYMCVLVLTLGFLVFEIVVGRICRSLLIAVDSFHTSPCSPDPSTTAGPSRPDVSSGGLSPPYVEDYRRMRLKPFGVLISALLMASQCVSISLEILTHLVQPEPIQHPLLSIVVGGTSLIFNVLCAPGRSGFRRQQLGFVAVIQDLLSSVLVLTNGLVLLLSAAHCHRPHSDCHLLVYLDAGFSAVCVLVLFSTALPRLRRYGLLVLQATPLHLSVAQVRLRLTRVPGVLSVHELHVWQLSEALLVASLHVHCPDGLNAAQCTDLMERITAALNAFGIKHCTVQPELIRSGAAVCSLRCGQECVEKLCCSPPETESPVCVQEEESCSPAPHRSDLIL
uniref:Cation efflux protein cytoplasmic domain-containing protein n=1 Tax=Cyprinus carpio TaxID=7962 RepID=A0A8C1I7Q6_CYPCA